MGDMANGQRQKALKIRIYCFVLPFACYVGCAAAQPYPRDRYAC